jgi:AAA+ superfamily predicted ATPase
MPDIAAAQLKSIIDEFRNCLRECEELYRSSAQECIDFHAHLIKGAPSDFLDRMLDLHRGLLIKIFVDIARSDWHWKTSERRLAQALFQHVWGKRLAGEQLKAALGRVSDQQGIEYAALVKPFFKFAPLRDRVGQLQTLSMRVANLVAKVDGELNPAETNQLAAIRRELGCVIQQVPLDEPGQHEAAQDSARQALQEMYSEATELRSRCALKSPKLKAEKKSAPQPLAEVLAELDELIGLDQIKQEVRGLANLLKMQQERMKLGLAQTKISLHMVFTGNPGTGKTTVARLVGRILGAMGILSKGHVIETDRSGLVAEYVGQTGPKMNRRVDEALDGVLFIDEAYSLAPESGEDPYGAEAVQILLKRMEDDRERLVVILAGYPAPMERLLKSNPGLSSRFSRRFSFTDYSASEMGRIFHSLCNKNQYELPAIVRMKLLLGFRCMLATRDEHFGNGRLVRNVFEQAIGRLANRIAGIAPITRELLTTFQPDDIAMAGVPQEIWDSLNGDSLRFSLSCTGCKHMMTLRGEHLGARIQCKRCSHVFRADWGEIGEGDE